MYKTEAKLLKHGEVTSFITSLPISALLEILEIPDPNIPFEDNRRVKVKHAREFGEYWENQIHGWIVPPLLLDTEVQLTAKPLANMPEGFFEIELPVSKKWKLKILDGQHRILGWYLKHQEINKRIETANDGFNKAVFANDMNWKLRAKEEIANLEYLQKRFRSEQIGVLIVSGISRQTHRQFFVDIAKNAVGINKTVQAKFDVSSIVNRVTATLMETHPLLIDRVDTENTKCSGESKYMLSVVNLADIVRHLGFGINGRVSGKKEIAYDENELFKVSISFFDLVSEEIKVLRDFQDETISAKWLRQHSLLGSGTIWRCLAGAYHDYCVLDETYELGDLKKQKLSIVKNSSKRFSIFLREFDANSKLPISKAWMSTGFFPKRTSTGPTSRSQDLLGMVKLFDAWIDSGRLFEPKRLKSLQR